MAVLYVSIDCDELLDSASSMKLARFFRRWSDTVAPALQGGSVWA